MNWHEIKQPERAKIKNAFTRAQIAQMVRLPKWCGRIDAILTCDELFNGFVKKKTEFPCANCKDS